MKKTLAALAMVASVNAFAGYSAEVCNITEGGDKINCRTIYFDRELGVPAKYTEPVVCHGETANTICEVEAGVPAWLVKFNEWFTKKGFTAPVDNTEISPGGGN